MRISDWSSDVCSSDLHDRGGPRVAHRLQDLHGVVGGHDPSRVIIAYELANSVVAAAFETSCANWNVSTPDPSTTRVSMPRFVVNVFRWFEFTTVVKDENDRQYMSATFVWLHDVAEPDAPTERLMKVTPASAAQIHRMPPPPEVSRTPTA